MRNFIPELPRGEYEAKITSKISYIDADGNTADFEDYVIREFKVD